MKIDLNLSKSSPLKGPRHLVSLIDRLRVNVLKTKYCKDVACICREKWSINHILFNCHQLKNIFRNSDLFPNSTIKTFSTDVLYNPQYFVPSALLLLKSPIGPFIWIVYECIFVFCMSVHMHFRVYVDRNCSTTINYCIIIKHDYYGKICLTSP